MWDLFTLWTVNPALGVRLMASNLDPRDYISTSVNGSTNVATGRAERSTSESTNASYTNWQFRVEMKL